MFNHRQELKYIGLGALQRVGSGVGAQQTGSRAGWIADGQFNHMVFRERLYTSLRASSPHFCPSHQAGLCFAKMPHQHLPLSDGVFWQPALILLGWKTHGPLIKDQNGAGLRGLRGSCPERTLCQFLGKAVTLFPIGPLQTGEGQVWSVRNSVWKAL